ncbi:MAG: winged helix-turn-helix transcriptional regulator [Planctomycetales bacterium]|nr:winged helix-turn-helix transcriptional regulator [bacterium]UNM09428.1 MAG: winged helix-turn-helix transcriptional regulator [Planctomycetales bacterium]
MSIQVDNTYRALADGTRREILDCLLEHGPLRATDLAAHFPEISRPAVSRHVRILREAGLLEERTKGRERWQQVRPIPLRDVQQWVRRYERYWTGKLDELARLVED